jgi:hypothetical protein
MATKDNFETQSARIIQAVRRLCPNCVVTFDQASKPHTIKFRIDLSGTLLTGAHPEYHVSEVADWTDQKLLGMIEALTAGRLGAHSQSADAQPH